jgi:hypothetical protein
VGGLGLHLAVEVLLHVPLTYSPSPCALGEVPRALLRPPHLSHKMHFRNVPCSVEPDNPRNPLNILRRLYKPGDYVAFKLVGNLLHGRDCRCTLLLRMQQASAIRR